MKQEYIDTVRLLIGIAPTIFKSPHFAMKGGTALNLFVQDMPRLSVDIDVVFTDHGPARDDALKAIQTTLEEAARELEAAGYQVVKPRKPDREDAKLFVEDGRSAVKIEVNHVFRGVLLPVTNAPLAPAAREMFASGLEVPMLDVAEIYGSKLVAAMDRQHPRDFFDVMKMQEKFGLDPAFVDCFVAYLAGHNRPIHEVLFSNDAPLEAIYEGQFRGMTASEISLEQLQKVRAELKAELPKALTSNHKKFLLSLVKLEPAWDLMPIAHLAELPALKWKLANLAKVKAAKPDTFAQQYSLLDERLQKVR